MVISIAVKVIMDVIWRAAQFSLCPVFYSHRISPFSTVPKKCSDLLFFSLWPYFSLELISKGPFLYFIFRQYSLSFKHRNTRTVTAWTSFFFEHGLVAHGELLLLLYAVSGTHRLLSLFFTCLGTVGQCCFFFFCIGDLVAAAAALFTYLFFWLFQTPRSGYGSRLGGAAAAAALLSLLMLLLLQCEIYCAVSFSCNISVVKSLKMLLYFYVNAQLEKGKNGVSFPPHILLCSLSSKPSWLNLMLML